MHRFKDGKLVRDELSAIETKELWDDKGVVLCCGSLAKGTRMESQCDMS